MTRVAILISGSGSNMVALVGAMQTGQVNAKPALVLSNEPNAPGLAKADSLGIATKVIPHRTFPNDRPSFDAEIQKTLEQSDIDIVCLAGFMRILTPEFVSKWHERMLNIHPSLLPKYPGLNTHARAIAAGDTEAGCTTHFVTPDLDAGPILGQSRVPILPNDNHKTLAARVLKAEHKLYPETLARHVERI